MGLLVSTLRQGYLRNYRWQLETKLQAINDSRLELTSTITDMANTGSALSPDSPTYKVLMARKEKLAILDKKMDENIERIKMQIKMIDAELDLIKGKMDGEIKDSVCYV
ncbi:MAG: hypothetical protein ACI4CY_02580 [Candidatus Gastranaerophilaceae bacterium]